MSKLKGSNKKKIPWKWEKEHQDAFNAANEMIKSETKLAFSNWAKPFHLYSDASDVQLSATLDQDRKPLGFYTRKLNAVQMNYTVGKKELLGLVKGIMAFEEIVQG